MTTAAEFAAMTPEEHQMDQLKSGAKLLGIMVVMGLIGKKVAGPVGLVAGPVSVMALLKLGKP